MPVIHDVADETSGPLAVADAALEGLLLEVDGVHVLPQFVRRPEAAAALHWPVKFHCLLPLPDNHEGRTSQKVEQNLTTHIPVRT